MCQWKVYGRGTFFMKNGVKKGKGLDLLAEPPRYKNSLSTPLPSSPGFNRIFASAASSLFMVIFSFYFIFMIGRITIIGYMQLTWVWVCCRCFKEVHVVAFRRSPNPRDLLVRALNSPTTTTHPSPLPAHSVAIPEMAASPAYTSWKNIIHFHQHRRNKTN